MSNTETIYTHVCTCVLVCAVISKRSKKDRIQNVTDRQSTGTSPRDSVRDSPVPVIYEDPPMIFCVFLLPADFYVSASETVRIDRITRIDTWFKRVIGHVQFPFTRSCSDGCKSVRRGDHTRMPHAYVWCRGAPTRHEQSPCSHRVATNWYSPYVVSPLHKGTPA